MNREAIVLYLENVRDLEVIKYKIKKLWDRESYNYNRSLKSTNVNSPKHERFDKSIFIWVILFFICLFVFLFAWRNGPAYKDESILDELIVGILAIGALVLSAIFGFISFIVVITSILAEIGKIFSNKAAVKKYENDILIADQNKSYNANLSRKWDEVNRYYSNEYNKADTILKKFYAMNIIPLQYRNLSGACYLYDYMSSCKESFQMALLSNQIEDGIRRIEAKLDIIINQLDTVIYQQRVITDENRQYIQHQVTQNNRMIDSLKSIENSQRNIEEYSRLSSYYNEAQAFISTAYYLRY